MDIITFSRDTYKFVIYINIAYYENKFRVVYDLRLKTLTICNKTNRSVNISATCENYRYSLTEMDRHNSNLLHLKDTRHKTSVNKNIIEKFNRFMFKNLDEEDLTDLNSRINNNMNKLYSALKIQKQQTVIQFTIWPK